MSAKLTAVQSPSKNVKVNAPVSGTPLYGCEHLQHLLTASQDSLNACISNYKTILKRILDDTAPLNVQSAKDTAGKFVVTASSNYLCLQCPTHLLEEAIMQHGSAKKHRLYVDSRSGILYCHICDDLVYDPTLEELRLLKMGTGSFSRRKRKIDDLTPDAVKEEARFISANTTAVSCRANGLRGLYNAGATCYQNVVLQSFLHNPILRNFYLADRHSACAVDNCLSCALQDIFQEFYSVETTNGYTPANVLSGFWNSDRRAFDNLVTTKEQDAHEFFQFLAEELHERNGDGTKPESGSEHSCQCIIHQIFYGKMLSTTTCPKCGTVTNSIQSFLDLSLGLDNVSQKRKKSDQRTLTLKECLDAEYVKSDKCEYRCQQCKAVQSARRQTAIKQLPNTLSIQLKRFEFKQGRNEKAASKIDTAVQFPLELNMLPYTTGAKRDPSREQPQNKRFCTYDLLAVVVHSGDTETGHYLAYCRVGDQWFKFNDHKVVLATKSEVLGSQAYLLFYVVKYLS